MNVRTFRVFCALLPAVVVALTVGAPSSARPHKASAPAAEPNVVLIMTDDMNDTDLNYMPLTQQLLVDAGTSIRDYLSPHPLCCPARAMTITGEYAQNNGVHHNGGPYNAANLQDGPNNVGRWVLDTGVGSYRTAWIGKALNDMGQATTASLPGWSDYDITTNCIFCSSGNRYWDNGAQTVSSQYTTYYVRDRTGEDIDRYTSNGHPFFIYANPIAPHNMRTAKGQPIGPPIPAGQDLNTMDGVPNPSVGKPSFNVGNDVYAHQSHTTAELNTLFHRRIESLQAVDRYVRYVVNRLAADGVLDRTYIVFTSDNGYLIGEHTLEGKNFPYEEDMQVPLVIRGPGIPAGATVSATANVVDLASTVADITGATPERTQDGRSLLPIVRGVDPGYTRTLIQAGSVNLPWSWRGVRNGQYTYVEHTNGPEELYDRNADPFELDNLAGTMPVVEAQLAAQLDTLRNCTGVSCQ